MVTGRALKTIYVAYFSMMLWSIEIDSNIFMTAEEGVGSVVATVASWLRGLWFDTCYLCISTFSHFIWFGIFILRFSQKTNWMVRQIALGVSKLAILCYSWCTTFLWRTKSMRPPKLLLLNLAIVWGQKDASLRLPRREHPGEVGVHPQQVVVLGAALPSGFSKPVAIFGQWTEIPKMFRVNQGSILRTVGELVFKKTCDY